MTIYCTAQHPSSPGGCYEMPNHEGQHRGLDQSKDYAQFYWSGTLEPLTFAPEEIGILLVALQPVQQFFPDLKAKLESAKEAAR